MRWKLPIRSAFGNRCLLALGALFTAGGTLLWILYTVQVWGAASMVDRLVQLVLAGAVAFGLYLLVGALENVRNAGQRKQTA